LNNEFPLPCREWEGVFDVWVNGDVQSVAKAVKEAIKVKEEKLQMKKQRAAPKEEKSKEENGAMKMKNPGKSKGKRKVDEGVESVPLSTPNKRLKLDVVVPPTPISMLRPLKTYTENLNTAPDPDTDTEPDTPTKARRVILRLPPAPPTPPSPPSIRPTKRPRPHPEVVITRPSKHPRFSGSLSPLTSLSSLSGRESLSPPPPSRSFSPSPGIFEDWRSQSIHTHPHRNKSRGEFAFDSLEDDTMDEDNASGRAKTPGLEPQNINDHAHATWYGYDHHRHEFNMERRMSRCSSTSTS